MRKGIAVLIALAAGVTPLFAQSAEEFAQRALRSSENLSERANTYRVTVDRENTLTLNAEADGERLNRSRSETTRLAADVQAADGEETTAGGDLSYVEVETVNGAAAQVATRGSLRLVNDTLFVDVSVQGDEAQPAPEGWNTLITDFSASRPAEEHVAFLFPGVAELAFDQLRKYTTDDTENTASLDVVNDLLSVTPFVAVERVRLADGETVEALIIELTGPQALEVEEFADAVMGSTDSAPEPLFQAMLEQMRLRFTVFVDGNDFFRGTELSLETTVATDDLRLLFGDGFPEGIEGSISFSLSLVERVIYSRINTRFPPVELPILTTE